MVADDDRNRNDDEEDDHWPGTGVVDIMQNQGTDGEDGHRRNACNRHNPRAVEEYQPEYPCAEHGKKGQRNRAAQARGNAFPSLEVQPHRENVSADGSCRRKDAAPTCPAGPMRGQRMANEDDREHPLEKVQQKAERAPVFSQNAADIGGSDVVASVVPNVNPVEFANQIAAGKTPANVGEKKHNCGCEYKIACFVHEIASFA